jgi:probable rRNA maturation factor
MTVYIENLQNKIELTNDINELIEKTVLTILNSENFKYPSEISIFLVDNERIRQINKENRDIDMPTDVLSFPIVEMIEGKINSIEGDYNYDNNSLVLGDIIISMEMVLKQSDEYGHSFEREIAFLVSHGVLHLLGYDHKNEKEESRMITRQESALKQLGLNRQ